MLANCAAEPRTQPYASIAVQFAKKLANQLLTLELLPSDVAHFHVHPMNLDGLLCQLLRSEALVVISTSSRLGFRYR